MCLLNSQKVSCLTILSNEPKSIFRGNSSKFPQKKLYEQRSKITEKQPCKSRNSEGVRAQHWGKNELRSYCSREDVVLLV